LRSILGRADITQDDITTVRNLMNGKPLESVQNDAESYVQTALSCLEMALPSSPCRDALHDFAMKMTKRVM
jgi:geranylgeranyl pyrophosphate synthase